MKFRSITKLVVMYLIFLVIVIGVYSCIFLEVNALGNEDQPTLNDYIYFSAITYLTIGYGDLAPKNNSGKYLAISEGIIGVIINAVFTGLIFFTFMKKSNPLVIPQKIYIREKDNKRYVSIKIGNKSPKEIIDIKVLIEFFRFDDKRRVKIGHLENEKSYIEELVYMDFRFDKIQSKSLRSQFKGILNKDFMTQIRVTVKGVEPYTGEIIYASKIYSNEDFEYIKVYKMIYEWSEGTRGKVKWKNFNEVVPLSEELVKQIKEDPFSENELQS